MKKSYTKRNKRIYKKTFIHVYNYVATHKRCESKIIARDLNVSKISVSIALDYLVKNSYIKERHYDDIGISYYYPSDKTRFCILYFTPHISHLIICNTALDVLEHFRYIYSDAIMPDENLHIFLKNAYKWISEYSYQKPSDQVYFFCPCKDFTDKSKQLFFPELELIDIATFVNQRMNSKCASVIMYKYDRSLMNPSKRNILDMISAILYSKLVKTKNKNDSKEKE